MYVYDNSARLLIGWTRCHRTIVSCSSFVPRCRVFSPFPTNSLHQHHQTLRAITGLTGATSSRWNQFKQKNVLKGENVWTVPNFLSSLRLGIAPVLGYMVIQAHYVEALGLFVLAGITDLADGWIARTVPGQASVVGSFLDPMADKVLVGVLYITLTYGGLIPLPLTALVLSRDAALMGAAAYVRFASLEPPRTLLSYFNFTRPTAQLAPTFISKVNTGVQLSLVAATLLLASSVTTLELQPYLVYLWYTAGATTVASAISYVFAKNTYILLKSHPRLQKARDIHGHLFKDRGNKNGRM